MLVSRTPLRMAVALGVAAMLAVLPVGPASAAFPISDLGAEPSQLWHSEFDASWPLDRLIGVVDLADATPPELPSAVVLKPGEYLSVGQSVTSPNGWYRLTLQPQGQLELRVNDAAPGVDATLWSSGPAVSAMPLLLMHADGDLALYDASHPDFGAATSGRKAAELWSTGTRSRSGAVLQLDDSGALTVTAPEGQVLWRGGHTVPDVGLTGSRHIIYDRGKQWVWLVDTDGSVVDNYPVSGNAESPVPGRYKVTSKSEEAISYNWLLTMEHMVRFTTDVEGDSIGFHSIPRGWRDTPVQTEAQLGDSLSLGCIRQRDDKAERLFNWASIGTPVVVLA
ncbi:L,D-transpeptidase family protein [Candidatus Poriferisodalis sp.]|uniref:L,D-transpeptidase family protein n=1 Tax=Candidatus Poriferisodalis sp. TaxID=3101277 RepID=UPI003B027E22